MRKGREPLPEGWSHQAFKFRLDPDEATKVLIRRHAGMRRKAHNWTVAVFKEQIDEYHKAKAAGTVAELEQLKSFPDFRKRWNIEKRELCVDGDTFQEWWPEVSKEAAANGISDAVGAYWDWVASRAGRRKGPKLGFPRFHKKGRNRDSYRISTGTIKLTDRRHVRLPRHGVIRLGENARRLDRLINKGMARIKSATVSIGAGDQFYVSLKVDVLRPQRHHKPLSPVSRVGIDVGLRWLAVVAAPDGTIIERVPRPKPLEHALSKLAVLQRSQSRGQRGSNRCKKQQQRISKLHAEVAAKRRDSMHKLTTRLAKTHGEIVIEDLNIAGMKRQKGLPGARARRRGISDAALGELRRQLEYKCEWYGSNLVLADRWFPSSQTCHQCGTRTKNDWETCWTCKNEDCGARHDRDDNAAINLARYGLTVVYEPVPERSRVAAASVALPEAPRETEEGLEDPPRLIRFGGPADGRQAGHDPLGETHSPNREEQTTSSTPRGVPKVA